MKSALESIKRIEDLGTFDEVLATSPVMADVARALRRQIAELMHGVTEVCWTRQRIASYGVGPKKMSEHFCYVGLNKAHVNLGFYYGSELPDPKGLLEGDGKLLRHVKIRNLSEAANPDVHALLVAASTHLPKLPAAGARAK